MNLIEKIIAKHTNRAKISAGDIVDIKIDARCARDFAGANVVKNLQNNNLDIDDEEKTYFTFDCNPGGSDQKYAANQHFCRLFAREKNINLYDVNNGIGTHLAIDHGFSFPGGTFVSTDSHANIQGAIGAFGQGMGDKDIAAIFAKGYTWFKVPKSVKLNFIGEKPKNVSAKDIVLNLLSIFGANTLLGYSVEVYGPAIDKLSLDERITISSMATEMGAIIILFTPNDEILKFSEEKKGEKIELLTADADAEYVFEKDIDISKFVPRVSLPGHPENTIPVEQANKRKIDSAFIGSCTNGRMTDMRAAAAILKDRKVAPGVILKIVPATDEVWKQCLDEGIMKIFKEAGALVSNAGCAGCAAGQVGQNGPLEVTVSTGNRNFEGKQGKGEVYLASPATVAASAVAGYITTAEEIPEKPVLFNKKNTPECPKPKSKYKKPVKNEKTVFQGRVWLILKDDIDTDMIFHNRYLTITDINEMGQYTFDNLKGYENFAKNSRPGDIIITSKNFGAGSSRQQAVDCFKSLGIPCIIAESFGAIYERNAINAALPVLTYNPEILPELDLENGDEIKINIETGELTNLKNNKSVFINKFSDVQLNIYKNGGLLA